MSNDSQILKIKCPHCGFIRRVDISDYEDITLTVGVKGVQEALGQALHKLGELLSGPTLKEEDAWIDMPACPNCENPYRFNLVTRKAA